MLICRRCKRQTRGWPVWRGNRCSPHDWVYCIRDIEIVAAENAARTTAR